MAQAAFEGCAAGHRIRIELGPALQTLQRMAAAGEEPFDFVFIDADKGGYQAYMDLAPRLVAAGHRRGDRRRQTR